jgi:HAD superfamily hydrolase (TIGR01509 family)
MPHATTIVFDIGGVLARICTTWGEAAEVAGIRIAQCGGRLLSALTPFDRYQAGQIDCDTYFSELSAELGCTADLAERAHRGILREPMPGTPELVRDLRERGFVTGCLSNTNEPHWREMMESPRFAHIAALDLKMASHRERLHKPDPAIFAHFARTFELRPEEIVYFDDHVPNVLGAAAAGWEAHLIDPEADPAGRMRRILGL